MQELKYGFFGVRGSYPVADGKVLQYGGNTTCMLIEKGDNIVTLDAGTGIINIGNYLKEKKKHAKKIAIFLTHFHIDHILGLPFFEPFFYDDFEITIYAPTLNGDSPKDIVLALFNQPYSPIGNDGIKAKLTFVDLDPVNSRVVEPGGGLAVDYIKDHSHPLSGVIVYKIIDGAKSLVFATDVESPRGFEDRVASFIEGADVLVHDSQYFDYDYDSPGASKKGFGHSSVSMAVANAVNAGVGKLYLFHYDPSYSDRQVESMLSLAREKFENTFLSEELKKFSL